MQNNSNVDDTTDSVPQRRPTMVFAAVFNHSQQNGGGDEDSDERSRSSYNSDDSWDEDMGSNGTEVRFIKIDEAAIGPNYATMFSGAMDVYLPKDIEVVYGRAPMKVPLGFRLDASKLPLGSVGRMLEKSSLALAGIHIGGGVLDIDYQGEVCAIVSKLSHNPNSIVLKAGSAIAQIMFVQTLPVILKSEEGTVLNLRPETIRGEGGFGSTGK